MKNKGILKNFELTSLRIPKSKKKRLNVIKENRESAKRLEGLSAKICLLMNVISNSVDISKLTSEDRLLLNEFGSLNDEQRKNELNRLQSELYRSVPNGYMV
jgi:hypothetical protein